MPATLTRLLLNPRNTAARADLAHRPGLHKTLMRLLPDNLGPQPRATGRLLFRLETGPAPILLIQTAEPPHLERLPDGYGTADIRDLTPMLRALTPGLPVHYRITAAPTISRIAHAVPHPTTGRLRGKIIPLTGPDALTWWQHRATKAGLEPITATATRRPFPRVNRETPGPFHALTQFDGVARITDPQQLATALHHGIGKGKSYGAGLLTLAPA
jgi:CRISPR system Cascade subunit CasE